MLRAGIITVAQNGSGDVNSVQEGIELAATGDTVLIENGTYSEPLLIEKSLTLTSRHLLDGNEAHIHNTILDGNDSFRIIYINGAQNVHINGLTIQNGLNTYPEKIKNKHLEIRKNKATEIDWGLSGSAINIENSSGSIKKCIIENNIGNIGSGICLLNNSDFSLKGNIIRHNHGYSSAGGIAIDNTSLFLLDSIDRCSVYMNTSGGIASDISFQENMAGSVIYLDTATVINPSWYYINCTDNYVNHIPDYEVDANAGKIEQVTTDIYVNPETGDNANSGITPSQPLESIWYALLKMKSEQNPPLTLHLAGGEYAASTNNERFPVMGKAGINIVGAENDTTLLNLEHITSGFNFTHTLGNHELKNVTIVNGGEHLNHVNEIINVYRINNISLENIIVKNYESDIVDGINAADMDTLLLKNSIVKNGIGYFGISLHGHLEEGDTYVRLESVKVNNITPNTGPDQAGTGGGIAISETEPSNLTVDIVNCEITENVSNTSAWTQAAGLFVAGNSSNVRLINSTIANNVSYEDAGVTVKGANTLSIYNSIIYDNSQDEILLQYDTEEGKPSIYVNYSNVHEGEDGIVVNGPGNVYWNEGNIAIDPIFTNYNDTTDYFLAQNSSCIHAGTMDINDFTFPEHDLMGNPRLHGIVDMGAYENPFVPVSTNDLPGLTNNVRVFPNPADGMVSVTITLEQSDVCVLEIFNNKGERIQQLFEGHLTKGTHTFYLNKAGELPAGVYLYTFKTGSTIKNGKIVIE